MAYCTAPKGDKGALSRYLCNFVRSNHGRFLRKEDGDGHWYEVGDEKAVSKCAQALREGTAALIRRAINDTGDSGGQVRYQDAEKALLSSSRPGSQGKESLEQAAADQDYEGQAEGRLTPTRRK